MSRRIIEVYVAAVCFTAMLTILHSAPQLFRARLSASSADDSLRGARAAYASGDDSSRRDFEAKLAFARELGLDYEVRLETLLLACAVLAGHVVLLIVAEAIFWRRARKHPIAAPQ